MKKYSVATAVLALLLTLCLAGCTGQNKTTAEQAEDPSAAPGTSTSKEVPSSDPQESDPPLPSHAESTTPSKDTPEPNVPVSQIQLDSDKKTLNKGESFTLQATILPEDATDKALTYTSSDAAVASVDQNGKVTAQKAGTATITVKASSGVSAACTVTVLEQSGDPLDSLDLSGATEISDFDGYGTILRVKSTGEVMFSPNLIELQKLVAAGASYDDFTALMRFTCLAGGEFDTEYTFPTIEIDPKKGKSAWVDFFLMGEDLDCGFCPTAGEHYNIEVAILKKNSGKCVIYGVYESIYADEVLKSSDYYDPTPSGATKREEGQYYIIYSASEGGSILGQARQLLDKDATGSSVSAVAQSGYVFLMWSDGSKEATRSDDNPGEDTRLTAYFVKKQSETKGVASMYLFTDSGEPVTSKNYESGYLLISGAANPNDDISATLQIKGRGNSSWNGYASQSSYDSKNSYRIKLDEKEKLLGIGDSKNKDWVLNSNKFDLSGLRNFLVWELADRMGSLPYVPDCTWVSLYINGEYRGMYMVCEHVEAAKDRVEIDDTINSTDKGYLIEVDFRGNGEEDPYFYISGYGNSSNGNDREFVIKSECTEADIAFIKDYMQKCHDAMVSGNKAAIEKLIDLPSLVDMYIIEELSKDVDVGAASCFLQKDAGGKLYFTAPWDFDFGFGTYGYATNTDELLSSGRRGCTWFSALIEHEWFTTMVYKRMVELDPAFKQTMQAVRDQAAILEDAADQNAEFWDMYGNKYHNYVSSQVSSYLYSYDEHIDFLVDWSETRWETMKELLQSEG